MKLVDLLDRIREGTPLEKLMAASILMYPQTFAVACDAAIISLAMMDASPEDRAALCELDPSAAVLTPTA